MDKSYNLNCTSENSDGLFFIDNFVRCAIAAASQPTESGDQWSHGRLRRWNLPDLVDGNPTGSIALPTPAWRHQHRRTPLDSSRAVVADEQPFYKGDDCRCIRGATCWQEDGYLEPGTRCWEDGDCKSNDTSSSIWMRRARWIQTTSENIVDADPRNSSRRCQQKEFASKSSVGHSPEPVVEPPDVANVQVSDVIGHQRKSISWNRTPFWSVYL